MRKFNNIQKYVDYKRVANNKFDLTIVSEHAKETYYTLDEKEVNVILKAHAIMDDRKFGRLKNEK